MDKPNTEKLVNSFILEAIYFKKSCSYLHLPRRAVTRSSCSLTAFIFHDRRWELALEEYSEYDAPFLERNRSLRKV